MMVILFLLAILSGIVSLNFNNKSKKYSELFSFFMIICLTLLMSCNNTSPDEVNLKFSYITPAYRLDNIDLTGFGYSLILVEIGNLLGIPFGYFNFITIFFAIVLITKTMKLYTKNYQLVIIAYILSCSIVDTTLFRQFLASSVVIYATQFILLEKNTRKYIFLILIATTIHFSMIFFMLFLLLNCKKNMRKGITLSVMVFTTVALLLGDSFIKKIISVIQFEKVQEYLTHEVGFGWLYFLLLWMIIFVFGYIASYFIKIGRNCSSSDIELSQNIIFLQGIMVLFLPLCLLDITMARLLRVIVYFNFILFSLAVKNRFKFHLTKFFLITSLVINISIYPLIYENVMYRSHVTDPVWQGDFFWIDRD